MSLFAELKRRNVFRVAAAYVVIGWLLLQVADIVLGFIDAPNWVGQALIALLLLGFVPVLALAWVFEVGPHGIRVDDGNGDRDGGPQARRLDMITLGAVVLVVALAMWQQLGPALTGATQTPSAASQPAASADDGTATTEAPAAAASAAPPNSIAVLPFVNMSAEADNEYFADGISEEILNLLAKTPGLRVAGRTSAFKFKGHNEDLRLIGEQLGVGHILEGSVRRAGERVRITAQLVQVSDGFHLWSDTWDRELSDIFAVQDEIGRAIVTALRGELLGSTAAPHVATTGIEAYNHYLRGQSLLAARGSDNLRAAREQFEAALALDADYVPALVGLARTLALLPSYARLHGEAAGRMVQEAERLARRAIALDDTNAHAHAVLGTLFTFYQWRWAEAEAVFERALALAPNDAEVANFAGDYYRAVRDPVRSVTMERRAIELDPLHAVNHWDMAWAYVGIGDYPNAIVYAESAKALAPARIDPYQVMVWSFGALGRFDEMRAAQAAMRQNTREAESEYLLADVWAAIYQGERGLALALQEKLEHLAGQGEFSPAFVGYNYLLLGDSERATAWLQRAYEQSDLNLAFPEPIDAWRIAADPKARAVLEMPGLKELFEIRNRNARAAGESR
jgi:TolB-like protein/tetratricopeptide (TPR) repeat protein